MFAFFHFGLILSFQVCPMLNSVQVHWLYLFYFSYSFDSCFTSVDIRANDAAERMANLAKELDTLEQQGLQAKKRREEEHHALQQEHQNAIEAAQKQ